MYLRNIRKFPNFKIFKVKKFTSKTYSTIFFWASFLIKIIEDLNLIFYIWVFNIKIEVIMKKKSNLNNTLLSLLGLWPKKMVSVYWSTLLVHFTRLAPMRIWENLLLYIVWEAMWSNNHFGSVFFILSFSFPFLYFLNNSIYMQLKCVYNMRCDSHLKKFFSFYHGVCWQEQTHTIPTCP